MRPVLCPRRSLTKTLVLVLCPRRSLTKTLVLVLVFRCSVPPSAHIKTGFFSPWRLMCIPFSPFPVFRLAFFVPIVTRNPAAFLNTIALIPFSKSRLLCNELRKLLIAVRLTWFASLLKAPFKARFRCLTSISVNNFCNCVSSY